MLDFIQCLGIVLLVKATLNVTETRAGDLEQLCWKKVNVFIGQ